MGWLPPARAVPFSFCSVATSPAQWCACVHCMRIHSCLLGVLLHVCVCPCVCPVRCRWAGSRHGSGPVCSVAGVPPTFLLGHRCRAPWRMCCPPPPGTCGCPYSGAQSTGRQCRQPWPALAWAHPLAAGPGRGSAETQNCVHRPAPLLPPPGRHPRHPWVGAMALGRTLRTRSGRPPQPPAPRALKSVNANPGRRRGGRGGGSPVHGASSGGR